MRGVPVAALTGDGVGLRERLKLHCGLSIEGIINENALIDPIFRNVGPDLHNLSRNLYIINSWKIKVPLPPAVIIAVCRLSRSDIGIVRSTSLKIDKHVFRPSMGIRVFLAYSNIVNPP